MPGIHHLDFTQEAVHQYLAALIDSVVLKDVVIRNDVRDVSLLEKLIRFIADNSGNIFSARSVADYFKKERRRLGIETVYNYLTYLETAYIINRVSRYDLKGKRQLETLEKYYITDIGLRHTLIGYKEQDINVFLENVVYLELRKRGYTVEIGKLGELEIDFIASKDNLKRYLQVAYLLTDEQTRDREFKPLRLVQDNFPKYVVSMDEGPAGNDNGIIRMYILDFLSSDEF
jgi:predicted AAA+ superfamily ATPase